MNRALYIWEEQVSGCGHLKPCGSPPDRPFHLLLGLNGRQTHTSSTQIDENMGILFLLSGRRERMREGGWPNTDSYTFFNIFFFNGQISLGSVVKVRRKPSERAARQIESERRKASVRGSHHSLVFECEHLKMSGIGFFASSFRLLRAKEHERDAVGRWIADRIDKGKPTQQRL